MLSLYLTSLIDKLHGICNHFAVQNSARPGLLHAVILTTRVTLAAVGYWALVPGLVALSAASCAFCGSNTFYTAQAQTLPAPGRVEGG